MQTKCLNVGLTEVKFSNTDPNAFEGYASVFGGLDTYGDTIEKGAYEKTLMDRERPIQMRWNHFGPVIGKWTHMEEDEHGLLVKGELTPGHSVASDVTALLKHGAVNGLSIGYIVKDSEERGGARVLKEIELIEISVVEEPADNAARVSSVKSAIQDATALKEIETILRDVGRFSKKDATALVSRIKSMIQSDSEQDEAVELINQLKSKL
jgi:HK97 family phage prohead protease